MSINQPHLHVDIHHRQGPLILSIHFTLTQPWTVLFGPSGSGKTTILRSISGFATPDTGTITFGHHTLLANGRSTPPHRRPIRTAAQSAYLFPNKTIQQNIAYGIPTHNPALLDETLHLFRIESLAHKLPQALSGGERQRASVARATASALATPHTLLLLDEPFSGLDLTLRDALAQDLRTRLLAANTPVLSVTHDVGEAFLLQAEVLRLTEGRIIQQGPATQVLAPERHRLLTQLSL